MFSVVNKSPSKVYGLIVGEEALNNNDAAIVIGATDADFELNTLATGPKYWFANASRGEEPIARFIREIPYELSKINPNFDEQVAQPANSTWDKYMVDSDRRYPSIYKTFANIVDTSLRKEYSSTLLKFDAIAPIATFSSTVLATPGKVGMYNVHIKIAEKDNYDPLPEVTFLSIEDVTTGTNPSPFSGLKYILNAENNESQGIYPAVISIAADAKTAKKYRINYSITDASDNQTLVSAVVVIPKK